MNPTREPYFEILAALGRTVAGVIFFLVLLIVVDQVIAEPRGSRQARSHQPAGVELRPRLPDSDSLGLDVQLVIDDDSAELDFGLVATGSIPFLWFNRFDVDGPLLLDELWALFPLDPALEDAEVEWVVLQDQNDSPLDGAELLRSQPTTVQAADGVTFSIYAVDPPVEVTEPHVYLGVISRYAEQPAPPSFPATLDVDGPAGQSWVAVWQGDPPSPPSLPGDDETFLIDEVAPGAWLIRGFGRPLDGPAPLEVPALGSVARTLLALWLALAAVLLLRRRRRLSSSPQGDSR